MKRDGIAMVKFLRWLKTAVSTGNETEISIDKKLYEFRAGQDYFNGISFDTIAGYKAHGAIVHYEASPETDIPLKPEVCCCWTVEHNIWTEQLILPVPSF